LCSIGRLSNGFEWCGKKALNARRVSLAPLDLVLQETQMEYGSITPFGLPAHWPILLDTRLANVPLIIIGSGLVKSKLSLPNQALMSLANVQIIEGLATKSNVLTRC
jgi:prolyl-tRNA editing enzyme YbaK/EbsC (Cys-tRNA(Pro) deacylase)